jgi:hypothetical protein
MGTEALALENIVGILVKSSVLRLGPGILVFAIVIPLIKTPFAFLVSILIIYKDINQ